MGSNGTMRFTWTASQTELKAIKERFYRSNGTMRFTWTASLQQRVSRKTKGSAVMVL